MGRLRDVFNLLRGRSVLESGGRTLDLDKLAFEYESPLSGGTYWLRRDSGTTDLDGKRVAPIFTTEDAARRWPGDGEPVEAQGALLAPGSGRARRERALDPVSASELGGHGRRLVGRRRLGGVRDCARRRRVRVGHSCRAVAARVLELRLERLDPLDDRVEVGVRDRPGLRELVRLLAELVVGLAQLALRLDVLRRILCLRRRLLRLLLHLVEKAHIAPLSAEDVSEETAAALLAAAVRRLEDALGGALERKRLKGHV